MELVALVEDYLAAKRAEGCSERTVGQSYAYPLRSVFLPWCEARGVTRLEQVNQRVFDDYQNELHRRSNRHLTDGRPLSKYTVASYIAPPRGLVNWARAEGYEVAGQPRKTRLPRLKVDILSRPEITLLEDAARTERDKLIIRLLGNTGLRVGELIALRPVDLIERSRQHYLHIKHRTSGGGAKGKAERWVPVAHLYPRLRRFIARGRPEDAADRIFVTQRRMRSGRYEGLSEAAVEDLVRWTARQAGITRRVYPHLLRHSAITWLLSKGGGNAFSVEQIAGNFSALRAYAHLSSGDGYEVMLRALSADED